MRTSQPSNHEPLLITPAKVAADTNNAELLKPTEKRVEFLKMVFSMLIRIIKAMTGKRKYSSLFKTDIQFSFATDFGGYNDKFQAEKKEAVNVDEINIFRNVEKINNNNMFIRSILMV